MVAGQNHKMTGEIGRSLTVDGAMYDIKNQYISNSCLSINTPKFHDISSQYHACLPKINIITRQASARGCTISSMTSVYCIYIYINCNELKYIVL